MKRLRDEEKKKKEDIIVEYKHGSEIEASWHRPVLPNDFSAETHAIIFQQMDITYTIERGRPLIKLYGCSQEGYSVALTVNGFKPYIYAPVPDILQENITDLELCENMREALNNHLKMKNVVKENVEFVELVEIQSKMPIMHYQHEKSNFFKITFSSPKYVTQARSLLENGDLSVDGIPCDNLRYITYESNVAFVLRFMIDYSIGGASWLRLEAGKYHLIEEHKRLCNTTIEASIHCEDLIVYAVDDEAWSHIAPLRVLSFDIECAGRTGHFPDPEIDPVIQIANYVSLHGQAQPIMTNVFVLNSCAPINGIDVRCYNDEKNLLSGWANFVRTVDPDILTGYNIVNFDLDYLQRRAAKIKVKDFDLLTRLSDRSISVEDTTFSSAQTGTRQSKEWSIEGRIVFDMYQVLQKDHKLRSYTLNNVSAHFLGQQKEDVHHSMISVLHHGNSDDRRRLAIYCCKDAKLPMDLLVSQMCLVNYVEMARVTGVPFIYLLTRGQSIKVTSQILRKARLLDILLPTTRAEYHGPKTFPGAKVMDPIKGLYEEPIVTLDFASLYPSIMRAHNLCFTTLIPRGVKPPEGVEYETTPIGERFVTNKTRPNSILPVILTDLLNARSAAKRLMAAAEKAGDTQKQQVYNGRQLALKVSANSVYGFTGQSKSAWPCLEISASVTAYGREMIMLTKKVVEEHYSIKNGWHCDAQVIYGDTDSVMIKAGLRSIADAIKMGKEAAALVSKYFPFPIKLEFEKIYYPYLLMSKKKYAGLFWTKEENYDKLDCKGIETVRRDNCIIACHVVDMVLRKILIEKDVNGAIEDAKKIISDILQNKIDLSLLIITKGLKKPIDDYKAEKGSLPAHVVLAEKLKARSPATAPAVGDRIPFIVVRGDKKDKLKDHVESPLYVLEHNMAIDTQYYLDQVVSPLKRLFKPIMKGAEDFFRNGEHTRKKVIPLQKDKGLSGFFTRRETCLGCKTPLSDREKTLCFNCLENRDEIYMNYVHDSKQKEVEYNRLWTHCQGCQGSYHQEVICSANDCPIFYKRIKARNDHVTALEKLSKFDLSW